MYATQIGFPKPEGKTQIWDHILSEMNAQNRAPGVYSAGLTITLNRQQPRVENSQGAQIFETKEKIVATVHNN